MKINIWVVVGVALIAVVLICGTVTILLVQSNSKVNTLQSQLLADQRANLLAEQESNQKEQLLQNKLDTCLQAADDDYWSFVKLNKKSSKTQKDGSVVYTASQEIWNTAEKNKQKAIDNCIRLYKQ